MLSNLVRSLLLVAPRSSESQAVTPRNTDGRTSSMSPSGDEVDSGGGGATITALEVALGTRKGRGEW